MLQLVQPVSGAPSTLATANAVILAGVVIAIAVS